MNLFFKALISLFLLTSSPLLYAQAPLNWIRDEINPGEDFTLTADDSFFTDGLKSVHMQLNSGAVPYLVSDVFYIAPGADYLFSIDVFDNDTAGAIKVYADFYDTFGFNIYGEPPRLSSDSAEWQTISWQGTIPSQAAVGYILVKFYTQPDFYHFTRKADIWIDNVQFNQVGTGNLVANSSFESWNVGIENPGTPEFEVNIFPNPCADQFNIILPDNAKDVKIYRVSGTEIYAKNVAGMDVINVDSQTFQESMYFVEIQLNNGQNLREKLIKY